MGQFTGKTIDDYIASFPSGTQKVLKQFRSIIKKTAPGSEETISYDIAAFRWEGRMLIYFAGFKKHTSLFPGARAREVFKKELENYEGGKGTVQFPLDKPLPVALITKLVKFRMKESLEKSILKAKKKK